MEKRKNEGQNKNKSAFPGRIRDNGNKKIWKTGKTERSRKNKNKSDLPIPGRMRDNDNKTFLTTSVSLQNNIVASGSRAA
jgi:hypothetical protein